MKSSLACLFAVGAVLLSARAADVTTKISDVHLCCKGCVTAAEKTVADKAPGAKAVADQDAETITLTGPDTATVQKAADALVKAGFFGKSSNAAIKISAETGAKGQMVQTLDVSNVHICCNSCVKAINKALKEVPGVKDTKGVEKNAKTFQVTGNFKDSDVFTALQKAGLTGKAGAGN
ncbi:MAG TPA: heavy-metal-associated domain-containing protein [Candidatus Acidoferrum sp.]|nr:heavy-metal-associated domain-containing protein [Candidatus Acidoferrum sp.]